MSDRFDLLEIDDVTPPAPRMGSCGGCGKSFPLDEMDEDHCAACWANYMPEPAPVPVPAADPVDAFAARMQREREERAAAGLPARLQGPAREVYTPAPVQAIPAPKPLAEQLIAVDAGGESTGAVVYWTLSGDLDLAKFTEAWTAAELPADWAIAPPSPEVAFTRACKDQQTRHTMVRRHEGGGYQFTFERYVGKDKPMEYETGPRFFLKVSRSPLGSKQGEVALHDSDGKEHELTPGLVQVISSCYSTNLRTVDADDVGTWMVWLCRRLGAVSLRQTGGIYFVPKDKVDLFHKAKAAVCGSSSHKVFEIPALKSEDAVAAILDAVLAEVSTVAEDVDGKIQAAEMGPRAAKARRDDLAKLSAKVRGYEKLLGKDMKGAHDQIAALDKRLAEYTPRASLLEVD